MIHCIVRRHGRIMAAKVTDDRDAGITWLANSCPRVIDAPYMVEFDSGEILDAGMYRTVTNDDKFMVYEEVVERMKEVNSR